MINKEKIKALQPCTDRYKNYLEHYRDREFTVHQFMGLKHITHKDKLWVAFRMLPKESIGKAAGEIAKTVLHLYEIKYPSDLRPRKAVEAAIAGNMTSEIRNAADAAYAAAAAYAATAAAYAATAAAAAYAAAAYAATAAAAADAAYAAAATAAAAAAADAAYAAYAAAYAAYADKTSVVNAREINEKHQRTLLIKYLKGVV